MVAGNARLTRRENQRVTRERLVEAARQIIVNDGLASASVRSISEAAGYSQGAFYSNFESKEHLLVEVLEHHMAGVAERLEHMADAVERAAISDRRAIPSAVTELFQSLNPKLNWSRLAVELWLHAGRSEKMAELYTKMRVSFLERAGAAFRRVFDHIGVEPSIPPEEFAMGLVSTAVGYAIQFGGPMEVDARFKFMSEVFRGVIATARGVEGEFASPTNLDLDPAAAG